MINRVLSNDSDGPIEAIALINTLAHQPSAEDCWQAVLGMLERVYQALSTEMDELWNMKTKEKSREFIEKKIEQLGVFSALLTAILSIAHQAGPEQRKRIQRCLDKVDGPDLAKKMRPLLFGMEKGAIQNKNPGLMLQAEMLAVVVRRLEKGFLTITYKPILQHTS